MSLTESTWQLETDLKCAEKLQAYHKQNAWDIGGGTFWSPCGRPHKTAEVAWAGVPLLNGFVGVW